MEVRRGESLIDIAMRATGIAENAILIAIENEISLTDELEPGMEIEIPETDKNRAVMNAIAASNGVASSIGDSDVTDEGIEAMGIEIDLIVS